jgi:hypothetical protein
MLLFGVTVPATVPQKSEIPEGLMNNSVQYFYLIVVLSARMLPMSRQMQAFYVIKPPRSVQR